MSPRVSPTDRKPVTDAEVKFYLAKAHELRAEAFCKALRWMVRPLIKKPTKPGR